MGTLRYYIRIQIRSPWHLLGIFRLAQQRTSPTSDHDSINYASKKRPSRGAPSSSSRRWLGCPSNWHLEMPNHHSTKYLVQPSASADHAQFFLASLMFLWCTADSLPARSHLYVYAALLSPFQSVDLIGIIVSPPAGPRDWELSATPTSANSALLGIQMCRIRLHGTLGFLRKPVKGYHSKGSHSNFLFFAKDTRGPTPSVRTRGRVGFSVGCSGSSASSVTRLMLDVV